MRATAAISVGAAAFLIVATATIAWRGGAPEDYFRDPAAVHEASPFVGAISNLGVLMLTSAGVICLFAARHARRDAALFGAIGAFSWLIAIDDLLMLHELVLPDLGLHELAILAVYGAIALGIFAVFARRLFERRHLGFFVATGFLAASAIFDLIVPHSPKAAVVEDSLKFVGLVTWAAYWIRRAHLAVPGGDGPAGRST